ncbi:MAG: class I SAM-dependent methyltransferase [Pseudomonadota bacterium]
MRCYLCNQPDHRVRKGVVRDDPSIRVLECTSCGLVALDSTQHITAGHYEKSGMHGEALPSMTAWLNETEHDDQRRFEMLKTSLANRAVLDFGCGAGGFLNKARQLASRAVGVELEQRVHEHWAGEIALHRDLEQAGRGYDLITAFHVVEHLPDPRAMLKELASRLAARGRLVIEVPSSDDALLTLFDNDAFQRFTYWSQHLFLFNAKTLGELAGQAGLRVVAVQQHQRYSLANHLHWLSQGKPGGHQKWSFLNSPELHSAYASALAAVAKCDTLIAYLELDD